MADIPGIIEGASEGRGLGLRFLRHVERNALLLFMIPADTDDIREQYNILLRELTEFNPDLLDKQRILAITKCDMLDEELMEQMKAELPEGIETDFISSITGMGLTELKDVLWRTLNDESNRVLTFTHRDLDKHHRIKVEDEYDLGIDTLDGDDDEDYIEDDWDEAYDDEETTPNHREEEW